MEIIKKYIKKEMINHLSSNKSLLQRLNIKKTDTKEKLKADFEIWLENLNRSMYLSKFRQVLGEIEYGKKNFDSIPSEHWRYKKIQLKAIFHIIKRKLNKYSYEITKENTRLNRSLLFWFNQFYLILEQLILLTRGDLNKYIDIKSRKVLKPIQYIYLGHIQLLYLLINYSYIAGEIQNICAYLSMVDRLVNYSGFIVNIHALPLLQKIYLFRVKIHIANCDYINGMKYVKKTIDLCIEQLKYLVDYDLNLDYLDKFVKDKKNPFKLNEMNKKVIDQVFINIVISFYLRGVIFELLGNDSNAFDSYKQSKFFADKFLKNKYYNFCMFFKSLQTNGYIYLSVMDELKELKEEKGEQAKINRELLIKKKYYQKLKYQRNYNKYYSNINTKHNLYKGDLKKFLDLAGEVLYKEEQNRHSILNKFTKTNYITSTMKMIDNLLSKDFKKILEKMDKVEVTKPSVEINGLINRALLKRRKILFNKNEERNKKLKDNIFNKKTQSTNINTFGDLRTKTINSNKNKKINIKNMNNININNIINSIETFNNSPTYYRLKQRPLSGKQNKANLFYRINNKYYQNKMSRNNSRTNIKTIKNRMNKSEQSSLDTLDNENSNKMSLSIAKNSFHIKSNSAIIIKKNKKYKNKNKKNKSSFNNSKYNSFFNSNYNSNFNSFYDKNFSSLFSNRYNYKRSKKISLNPKKEFRIDRENFAKDYINKKIFLDKYCNEEIKFHRKLLQSKSCEIDKEPNEFDIKKTRRDADLAFNKIFELCKSETNKKNISKYMKLRNMANGGGNNVITTSNDKKDIFSFYEVVNDKEEEDRILDEKEKKNILLKNEEKMKELNLEYEQMIQKEQEIKEKKIKLLEEIMGRK